MSNDLGAFFLLGPSQTGKSNTINTIAGEKIAAVGNGSGHSCTEEQKIYSCNSSYLGHKIHLIDIPGFNDSRLALTNEQILNQIKLIFIQARSKGLEPKGFIVTESISSGSLELNLTLDKLFSICGANSLRSTIVLASKADLIEPFQMRFNNIINRCNQYSVPCVKWSNMLQALNENEVKQQAFNLIQALSSIVPYNIQWMDELDNEIRRIAQFLAEIQKRPSDEDVINKAKEFAMNAPKINVAKVRNSTRVVKKTEVGGYWKDSGGFIGKLMGKERWVETRRDYEVNEPYTETYYELEPPDYNGFLNVARNCFVLKRVEDFLQEAANIKFDQFKELLR